MRTTLVIILTVIFLPALALAQRTPEGPIVTMRIEGSINVGTDDFLKSSMIAAEKLDARLFIIELDTPGGFITAMEGVVKTLLESKIPTVVYVSPSGAGAMSAGVFITLAGHYAVMAPATRIGSAHPVSVGGGDLQGDMRAKIENNAVSLMKAIAEQRGRNVAWAELAVRESVALTAQEALDEKVIDFIASDISKILEELEGRTLSVGGDPITLAGLRDAPRKNFEMTFKQQIVSFLSDPNISVLLGLGALLGLGLELFHPGGMLPGIFGIICLILWLTSYQLIPIALGGVALLLLGAVFFIIELLIPSFGIWGGAGIVCFVVGSIYFIDTSMVWGIDGVGVDKLLVGSVAAVCGLILLGVCYLALKSRSSKSSTGKEGLAGQEAVVKQAFVRGDIHGEVKGRVMVMGELWNARLVNGLQETFSSEDINSKLRVGTRVTICRVDPGMTLVVEPIE